MITALHRIRKKLHGRSLDEVRVRGGQAVAAWRERMGLDDGVTGSVPLARRLAPGAPAAPEALLARFRSAPPRFWAAFDDPSATIAALRARCPDAEADVLARAERVLARRFDLMGHRGLDFGTPIDWQYDPTAGTRAPLEHWSRVPYLDPARVGDHKVVWELSRQQYLVTLGQAYWYTGDERYADDFAALVTAWLDANAGKRGMNWASSLEVAFRAMSWLYALRFFAHSPALTPALYARVLDALHVHAEHLARYLSTYFSPNTHLTGEALGLVFIGSLAPELAGAGRWRALGERILLGQISRQQRADGVYFEQATQYHRYTTEFYLHLLLLTERQGRTPAPELRACVPRLLEFVAALSRPDGTIPLLGDDDGGRLVQFDGRLPDDVRGLLLTGSLLYDRPEWRGLAGDDVAAALWLLGPDAHASLDARPSVVPQPASHAFPTSGFFVLREGAGATASHAVVDCGPHGVFNCGHAHADALALTLTLRGRHLFVDAGTYTYPGPERNAFRGGTAHNVVTLDGRGSSEPADSAFQWRTRADGRPTAWVADPRVGLFRGEHAGFADAASPAICERTVVRVEDRGWVVRDRLHTIGAHRREVRWLLAPGLRAEAHVTDGDRLPSIDVFTADGDPVARIAVLGDGRWELESAWVSPQYGARLPTTRLLWVSEGSGHWDVTTLVLPPAAQGLPTPRRASGEGDGRGVLISAAGATDTREADLVLLGGGGHASLSDAVTDAAFAWVSGARTEVVTVGGEFLRLAGETIVRGAEVAPGVPPARCWAVAVREGERWRARGGDLAIRADSASGATHALAP